MIYPNNPLYLLSLLGYIYYLTYYTLTTKDNIYLPPKYKLLRIIARKEAEAQYVRQENEWPLEKSACKK